MIIVWLIATVALALLIWAVAKLPAWSAADARLHDRLIRDQGAFWHLVAGVTAPKLMVVWCFLLAGILLWQGRPLESLLALVGLGGANVIGIVIKHTLKRARPDGHLAHDDGYSFPSGHVLGSTVMPLMIGYFYAPSWWGWGLLLLWWGLVAYSRLTLKAHYPSDVVGATLLGVSWLSLVAAVVQYLGI